MTPLLIACENENVEIVQRLLPAGADVEAHDPSSRTALHYATFNENVEVMRELILHHNANMIAANAKGETPFDMARRQSFPAINPLLQIYGIKMTHDHGRLALHVILCAAEYSFAEAGWFHPPLNPLRIILPLGTLTLNHFHTLLHSLDTALMIRYQDFSGTLPIHFACRSNAPVQVLALLLELNPATLHIADRNSGALPLHECCQGMVDYSTVRYLVEQGGVRTLATRNHKGALPLHILCGSTNPSLRTVQYMMQSFPGSVATRTYGGQHDFCWRHIYGIAECGLRTGPGEPSFACFYGVNVLSFISLQTKQTKSTLKSQNDLSRSV